MRPIGPGLALEVRSLGTRLLSVLPAAGIGAWVSSGVCKGKIFV